MPSELAEKSEALTDYVVNELPARIDEIAADQDLTHPHLSERLANQGLLPMFGFPTRVRHLFHREPRKAYPWPPERGVVDRNLDFAISQFAPGSETVKDKRIHTAVGVADYRPSGGILEADSQPLGTPIEVGVCGACKALDTEGSSADRATCPVCGDGEHYRRMRLSEPRGFITDFTPGRNFEGSFEWTPRASRPRMSASTTEGWRTEGSARVWTGKERVYAINDNDGRDFEFQRLSNGSGWVVSEAFPKPSQLPNLDKNAGIDRRALVSITTTDVMLVGFDKDRTMPGLDLSPLSVSGRAAWFSFGFLLRSAAASFLDVDRNELRVGLRPLRLGEQVEGEVFLSDSLENGAGYSTYIGRPTVFDEFLRYLLKVHAPLLKSHRPQGQDCDSACYDCLRDYANMAYHGLLDWRLALDMARLAAGQQIGLSGYWHGIGEDLVEQFCKDFDGTATRFGALPGVEVHDRALIAIHPLWNIHPEHCVKELSEAILDAKSHGFARWETVDLFDLSRRPTWVMARIWQIGP